MTRIAAAVVIAWVCVVGAAGAESPLALKPPGHRLAAAYMYTCWSDDRGELVCWGELRAGHPIPPTPQQAGRVVSISQGTSLCIVRDDGTIRCPRGEPPPESARRAVDVGAGVGFGCALAKDGRVSCWGNMQDKPPKRATQISVGETHACARLANGTAYCWGQNSLGQLGAPASPHGGVVVPKLTNVAGVSVGSAVSCAWKTDGSAWCWGDRAFGGLGSLGTSAGHTAHPVPVRVPGVSDVVAISAGSLHSACALDRAGAVTCWGHDYQGVLGADVTGDSPPVRAAFTQPVLEVRVGGAHACVRAKDGSVWCWGWNEFGQLGDDQAGATWRARKVATGAAGATTVASAPPPTTTAPTSTTLPSGARRVELVLDSARALTAGGWKRIAGGQSTFSGGALHLEANGFEEWSLGDANNVVGNPFMSEAGNPPGWAVEVKLQLDKPCKKLGTGLWIHDGFHFVDLRISDHEVKMGRLRKDIGSTLTPRVLRVALDHETLTLSVDGRVVGTSPAGGESGSSRALMFGVLGDGCGKDRSTWYSIAYETFPAAAQGWPPRKEWHPGTTSAKLIDVLPAAARTAAKGLDAACIAITVVDAGTRDLLALAYDAVKAPQVARELAAHPALVTAKARNDAMNRISYFLTPQGDPICTPAPGGRCPPRRTPQPPAPVPPIATLIAGALRDAGRWGDNPEYAVSSIRAVASAYAQAVAAKVPGASAALDRLTDRLAKRSTAQRCGL
jgi:hypothetical protein